MFHLNLLFLRTLSVRRALSVITAWPHDRETKDKKPFRADHSVLQVICYIKLQDLPLFGVAHPPRFAGFVLQT